jgi:SM-20-related protein
MSLRYLDMAAFRATPRASEPFEYLVVPGFVRADACARINADYPTISERGSFPVAQLAFGSAFREFLDELESDEFRAAFEEKFNIDLTGRPTTITVRGQCSPKDGQIHTDSLSKIITVLIYMNPAWEESGGRLRLLRSGDDLDDVITEVPPTEGTLLAFRRADNSWHGHKPFSGPRRAIQFNWVTSEGNRRIAMLRHHLSAPFKRVMGALRSSVPIPRFAHPCGTLDANLGIKGTLENL